MPLTDFSTSEFGRQPDFDHPSGSSFMALIGLFGLRFELRLELPISSFACSRRLANFGGSQAFLVELPEWGLCFRKHRVRSFASEIRLCSDKRLANSLSRLLFGALLRKGSNFASS